MERMKTSVIYRNLQALADKSEEGRKLLTLYEVLVGIEDPLWVENRWEETQEGWTWKVYSLLYAPQLQEEIYLSIHGWRYPLRDMPHTIQAWALDLIDLLYRERCAKETYLRRKDGP